jgi:pimeloyl-ACP methyl ester carboxylesterase
VFGALTSAGVDRAELILAWDFTVASTGSLTGRMLATRDQGLVANGAGAPPFHVTSVEDDYSDQLLRRVRGTYTVPLFLTSAMQPTTYNLDESGVPRQNGTAEAPFTVVIPRLPVTPAGAAPGPYPAARPIVYGHGLLGSGEGEVDASNLQTLAMTHHFVLAATDWIGLSEADVLTAALVATDLSFFPRIVDRLQQAQLNQILLGRLMIADDGFASDPAFEIDGGQVLDRSELFYYGNSEGGIEGMLLMALEPDLTRGVIGVGAANYSILLQRSVDFTQFQEIIDVSYEDQLDRAFAFPLLQQLWDRGEPQGYLSHVVRDPLPGTPAKKVLVQMSINDAQVPNIGTEIMVRSLGIPNLTPTALPLFGVPGMDAPFDGSAFVPYDVGAEPPIPLTNTPLPDDNGAHEAVRRLAVAQSQIDAFLRTDGRVESFCDGPCNPD